MPTFVHLSIENVDVRVDHIVEIIEPRVVSETDHDPSLERRIVMERGHEYDVTASELAQIREAIRQSETQ